jgi:hypothetical protein
MELTEGSETPANYNLTPGKYPKEQIHYSKHGESLKSRRIKFISILSLHKSVERKLGDICGSLKYSLAIFRPFAVLNAPKNRLHSNRYRYFHSSVHKNIITI